jgi:hypothetical protein
MVGPAGERWVPVHGLLPHERLIEAWQRIQQLFSPRHGDMDQLGVGAGAMFAAVSPSACLIEPVFYRPDELETLHRRTVEPEHLERLTRFAANEESRVLVKELRAGVIRVFRELQATHLQIAIASTDQSIEEVRQRLLES